MDIDFKVYAMLVGSAKKMLFAVIVLWKHSKDSPEIPIFFPLPAKWKQKKESKISQPLKKKRKKLPYFARVKSTLRK